MDDKVINKIEKVDDAYVFETYEKPLRTQIEQLKNELDKKNKEISKLKNELLQPQSETINSKEDVIDTIQSLNLLQNQKTIEELENFYKLFEMYENSEKDTIICFNGKQSFLEYVDERIKELKGDNND